jgi:hypothetical protein
VSCVAEPVEINLCRRRGDTFADEFTIKDAAGAVIDISGFSFLLTVDPSPNPTDSGNNLFQLTGSLTDPTNGVVQFAPSAVQSDQTPSVYFYDIQMTDGGGAIRTIAVGEYEIFQDVTK